MLLKTSARIITCTARRGLGEGTVVTNISSLTVTSPATSVLKVCSGLQLHAFRWYIYVKPLSINSYWYLIARFWDFHTIPYSHDMFLSATDKPETTAQPETSSEGRGEEETSPDVTERESLTYTYSTPSTTHKRQSIIYTYSTPSTTHKYQSLT